MTCRSPLSNQDTFISGTRPDSVDGEARLDEAGVSEGGERVTGVRVEGVEEHCQTWQVQETEGRD